MLVAGAVVACWGLASGRPGADGPARKTDPAGQQVGGQLPKQGAPAAWWNLPFDQWTPEMFEQYRQWVSRQPGVEFRRLPKPPPRPSSYIRLLSAVGDIVAVVGTTREGGGFRSHVWLYRIGQAAPLQTLEVPRFVWDVCVSPSGKHVATAEWDLHVGPPRPPIGVYYYDLGSDPLPVPMGAGRGIRWLDDDALVVERFTLGRPASDPSMLTHPLGLALIGETKLVVRTRGDKAGGPELGPFRNRAAWDVASRAVWVASDDALVAFRAERVADDGWMLVHTGHRVSLPETELGVRVVAASGRRAVAVGYPQIAGYGEAREGARLWQMDAEGEPLIATLPGDAVTSLAWSSDGARVLAITKRFGARTKWYASTVVAGRAAVRREMDSRQIFGDACPLPKGNDFLIIERPDTVRSVNTGSTVLSWSRHQTPEASWGALEE